MKKLLCILTIVFFYQEILYSLENGLARTPPMGWSSWNCFHWDVTEQHIKEIADAMSSNGMREAGYEFVNVDDSWEGSSRDANGDLTTNSKFPSGIKALADYVHSKGLKFGIYTGAQDDTCCGYPASGHYEYKDAVKFASWGVDYCKVDWCYGGRTGPFDIVVQYSTFADAFMSTGRPITYSICLGQQKEFHYIGNLWRTGGDITDTWSSILDEINGQANLYNWAGPGRWNDPDMLEVGNGGLTDTEYRAHFSMWAIMAAPLIAGNDLRTMSQATKDILLAPEVIAIDQDILGYQGRRVTPAGDREIWKKELYDGSVAVALFNKGSSSANMTVNFSDLWSSPPANVQVRNSWTRQTLGTFSNSYTASVPSHGVVLLRMAQNIDTTPPSAINTLSIKYVMSNGVVLEWTSPGNDGNSGTAVKYDIRFATFNITNDDDFRRAMTCLDEPAPLPAGNVQTYTVGDLNPSTRYYFAIKTMDGLPNTSALSNIVTAVTEGNDTFAPSTINDLTVISKTDNTVTLRWTAPGDDGTAGIVFLYDLRYSFSPITDIAGFNSAKKFFKIPGFKVTDPLPSGSIQTVTVDGLAPNTRYYFSIRSCDELSNFSDISNCVSVQTNPISWNNKDIGNVGIAGSCTIDGNTFTVKGSGSDIYPVSDAFHYVYTTARGDCTITARLVSMQNTDSWAKVGVMIRSSPDPSACYAMTILTPGNGAVFQAKEIPEMEYNLTVGQSGGKTPPYWLRLKRSSYTYISEISPDGSNWTQLGTKVLYPLKSFDVYVGLCVCSHNNSVLNTSVFDNVKVEFGYAGSSSPVVNDPPNVPLNLLCNGILNPKGISTLTPTLSWNFTDPDTGDSQSGYQILVSKSLTNLNNNTGDIWDTGHVNSSAQSVLYAGATLESGNTYYWKVRVWDTLNAVSSYSAVANFSIQQELPPQIAVLSPNGGQTWTVGTVQTVTWTWSGTVGPVNIDLSTDGGSSWANLVSNTANDGSQTITVPNYPSTSCRIRVAETDGTPSDTSDSNFSIVAQAIPVLHVDVTSLEFGEVPFGKTKTLDFQITNAGSGTLTGTISCPDEWVSIVPESFSGDTVVNVTVDNEILSMNEGIFVSTITINSNGGTAEIPVYLTATCVLVKPNPYNPEEGSLVFFGSGIVPGKTEIKIYTLSGEKVIILKSTEEDEIIWDGKDEIGNNIMPGIYIYTYESPKEKGVGKFTVKK